MNRVDFPVLHDVSFQFGARPILGRITLTLKHGAINCLLGPSGCGKSTLLRVAGGLLRTGRGTVLVDPQDCALVFQDARLLRWLTVAENLALALANHPRRERQERIAAVLALMQLQGIQHHLPSELSGGMAQRVGIARALLRTPRLMLMDEPLASLDAITRSDLQGVLKELLASRQQTCLFVTHDVGEAIRLGERLFVMRDGMIVRQMDRPWESADMRTQILRELESRDIAAPA